MKKQEKLKVGIWSLQAYGEIYPLATEKHPHPLVQKKKHHEKKAKMDG